MDDPATPIVRAFAQGQETTSLIDEDGRIRGTGVEAHRIAALLQGGMAVDEVLRDYPNLVRLQIDAALAYAEAKPHQGAPYPVRTVKSVLRNGKGGLARAFAAARDGE